MDEWLTILVFMTESVDHLLNATDFAGLGPQAEKEGAEHSRCAIFAAGSYYEDPPYLDKSYLIVAADGGLDYISSLGITPHAVIGDDDSLRDPSVCQGLDPATEMITLPSQKDDTDLVAAIKYGWEQGIHQFDIYGALGGQIDHTIASLKAIALVAEAGGIAFLHGDRTIVTAISQATMTFQAGYVAPRRMISLFAHSRTCSDLTIEGLKYELSHAQVDNSHDFGSRNEFLPDRRAMISLDQGTLLVTYPSEAPYPTIVTRLAPADTLGPIARTVSDRLNRQA